MPGNRPYDPNILLQRIDDVATGKTAFKPLSQYHANPTVLDTPGYEAYPGKLESLGVAFRGLGRVFTADGRSERAQERAERLQHRQDVARFIADKVMDPRSFLSEAMAKDPATKLGWVGTSNRDSTPVKRRPEDWSNLGFRMLDIKRLKDPIPPVINKLRPTTRSHRSIDRRIENKFEKLTENNRNAQWVSGTYGQELNRRANHHLSRSERRRMSHLSHHIHNETRSADKARRAIVRIRNSEDLRSVIPNWRLRRAQEYDTRVGRRHDAVRDTRDSTVRTVRAWFHL